MTIWGYVKDKIAARLLDLILDSTGTINPKFAQAGRVTGISVAASSTTTVTITFPAAFDHAPAVQLTPDGGVDTTANLNSVSSATADVILRNGTAAAITSRSFRWLAIDLAHIFQGGGKYFQFPPAACRAATV
jgi:hypothetical protein